MPSAKTNKSSVYFFDFFGAFIYVMLSNIVDDVASLLENDFNLVLNICYN